MRSGIGVTCEEKTVGEANTFPLNCATTLSMARNALAGMREVFITVFDLRRDTRQAAAFLTDRGFRIAPATLNKLRCVGGGPAFEKFGRRPLYSETSLLAWVQARTTGPLRSSSDAKKTARTNQSPPRPIVRPRKSSAQLRVK
jgi:hypothetical protein